MQLSYRACVGHLSLKNLCAVQEQGYVPFELDYGGEGVRGNPVNDTVRIGGMSLVNQSFAGVLDIVYGDFLTVILVCRLTGFLRLSATFVALNRLSWDNRMPPDSACLSMHLCQAKRDAVFELSSALLPLVNMLQCDYAHQSVV